MVVINADNVSIWIDQELVEIPVDCHTARFLKPGVEWVGTLTNNVDLFEHREFDAVGFSDVREDFKLRVWFLRTELVAREGENLQS